MRLAEPRSTNYATILQRLRDSDPAIADELESVHNNTLFDAVHAGFVAGWQCCQSPDKLIFEQCS